MKIPNLHDLMISLSDFKKEISNIILHKKTKVIIKNNEPVSVVMPYTDYLVMSEQNKVGEDITLSNGVQVKVTVDVEKDLSHENIVIRTWIKMKTSGEYVLHYTYYQGAPHKEQAMTNREIYGEYEMKSLESKNKEEKKKKPPFNPTMLKGPDENGQ